MPNDLEKLQGTWHLADGAFRLGIVFGRGCSPIVNLPGVTYSARSAPAGSIAVARRAGI